MKRIWAAGFARTSAAYRNANVAVGRDLLTRIESTRAQAELPIITIAGRHHASACTAILSESGRFLHRLGRKAAFSPSARVMRPFVEACRATIHELCDADGLCPLTDELRVEFALLERRPAAGADQSGGTPAAGGEATPVMTAKKRSTVKGEARTKIISGLTEHHQYDNGSCGSFDPIGVNRFAKRIDVSPSQLSTFLKKQFGGYKKYRAICIRDTARLVAALKFLNDEYSAHKLFGDTPPDDYCSEDANE